MDERVFRLVNGSLAGPVMDRVMLFLSSFNALRPLLIVFAVAGLLFGGRKGRLVLLGALAVAGATDLVASRILKPAVGRVRPCAALEDVRLPGDHSRCPKSAAFPSGHASNSFAVATYVSLNYPSLALVAFPLAACVAFARVYVGVHFPGDVIGGAVIGTALAILLVKPLEKLGRRLFPPRPAAWVLDRPTLPERAHAFLLASPRFGYRRAFYALLALSTLVNLAIVASGRIDLSPDEAHYWLWSRNLDLSYYSKGPMVAYLIAASTRLGVDSPFFVRLPAVVLSAASCLAVFWLARSLLASETLAFLAVLCLRATPLFSLGGAIMTIDPPFLFFWALALVFFRLSLEKGGWRNGVALGAAFGLGFLSKYTMAAFAGSAALCLVLSPALRAQLRGKAPLLALACLIATLLTLPVFIWNSRHDWITFRHLLGLAQVGTGRKGLAPEYLAEFLGGQLGVLSPLLAAAIAWALFRTTRRAVRDRDSIDVFLAATSVPLVLAFLMMSLRGRVHPNWPAPAYVTGAIAAVREAAALWKGTRDPVRRRRLAGLAQAAILVAVAFAALGGSPGFVHLLAPHFPLSLHPTARLEGWRELGEDAGRIQQEMGGPEKVFLVSNTYQTASELAFYVPGHPKTYNARFGRRLDQFDFWPEHGLETVMGKDAVYVTMGHPEFPKHLETGFESCEREPTLTIQRHGQAVRDFALFRCREFRGFPRSRTPIHY